MDFERDQDNLYQYKEDSMGHIFCIALIKVAQITFSFEHPNPVLAAISKLNKKYSFFRGDSW